MRTLQIVQSRSARHQAIRKVLRAEQIGTQEDLCRVLAREGFRVTQATLSRDLQQLGAVRVGGLYQLPPASPMAARLREVGDLIVSFAENDHLVVLRTQPGAASAVALAVDTAHLPECLGTLAGDDTIFATPVRGVPARKLSRKLRNLFGRELS
jgi:transcriptional regulator of arginine metabolism